MGGYEGEGETIGGGTVDSKCFVYRRGGGVIWTSLASSSCYNERWTGSKQEGRKILENGFFLISIKMQL